MDESLREQFCKAFNQIIEDRERHLHFWQQKQESGTALEKYRAEQMAEITAGGPIPYEVKELTQAVLQEAWLQENGTVRFIFLSGTADFG